MLKNFLIIFFFAFLYKLVRNLSRFIRIKILYKYYYSLCTPNTNPKVWETKQETINLFKIAGIKDSSIPVSKKYRADVLVLLKHLYLIIILIIVLTLLPITFLCLMKLKVFLNIEFLNVLTLFIG